MEILRNSPCHCGSGYRYKWCCMGKDQAMTYAQTTRKQLEQTTEEVELKAILFCPPGFYQLDGTQIEISNGFKHQIKMNPQGSTRAEAYNQPGRSDLRNSTAYNTAWTFRTPPLLNPHSLESDRLGNSEKEQIEALVCSLQYQFSNDLILTARDLVKHPYGEFVPDPLRPVFSWEEYRRSQLGDYAPFGTDLDFQFSRIYGVQELRFSIFSVLLKANQKLGQKKIALYLVNSTDRNTTRSALLLNSISTSKKLSGHWELQPTLEAGDSEGFGILAFISSKNKPEQGIYHLRGYEINTTTGTLEFHQTVRSLDIVNTTVDSDPVNRDRLRIPLRSHGTILNVIKTVNAGFDRDQLPRIQRGTPKLIDASKIRTELHLSKNGDLRLLRKVQLDTSLALWNLPQSAAPLLAAFSQGLIGCADSKAAEFASSRRGQKRERDMKVLKHVGIFSAIFLETASFLLFKKTSEGLTLPGKPEFVKNLFERLAILLKSLDPLDGLADDPYDDYMRSQNPPFKPTVAPPPSLDKLCSRSVTLLIENFVSEMEALLETTSEVLFTRQGEIHILDSFRFIFEFFHSLLIQAAIESQGKCFLKSRTSVFANFLAQPGERQAQERGKKIPPELKPVQIQWPDSPPACPQVYALSGTWLPPNRVLRCLLPLRANTGISIVQDGLSFVEMNPSDFRPEFTMEDRQVGLKGLPERPGDSEFVTQLDWFELHPKFFFKGEEIPLERLDRLANEGVIEFQGKLYLVPEKNLPSIKKLEFFWSKIRSGTKALSNSSKEQNFYLLQKSQTLEMLALRSSGVSVKGGKRWQAICQFYDSLDQRDHAFNPPATVRAVLKPYQKDGVRWMLDLLHLGLGGILADDMGLGKTLQALTFLETLRLEQKMGHVLIVVPTSLTFNWIQENEKFTPLIPMEIFQTENKGKLKKLLSANRQVAIISTYGLFLEHQEVFEEIPWKVIIFDEAQNLKNISAKRSTAARKIKAEIKFCLTGTPLENHLGEFFSLIDLVVPGCVGQHQEFNQKFVSPDTLDREQVNYLKLKIKPLIMRRTKSAILSELPPKIETTIKLPFEKKQEKIYRDIAISCNEKVKSAILTVGEARSQLVMLTALLRLRQACSDPAAIPNVSYPKEPPKMTTLLESLGEVTQSGESALVFTQFLASFERIRRMLEARGFQHYSIHGGTSRAERETILRKFQASPTGAVLLMTLKTGGVGLNLTKASYVFHLEPWWNPAVENQATDRAHRMGQEKPVQVYRYLMAQSVEEKIEVLKERKAAKFNALFSDTEELGPVEKGSGQLSQADFEYLLS